MWCAGGPIPIPHSFLGQVDGCDLNNIQLGRDGSVGQTTTLRSLLSMDVVSKNRLVMPRQRTLAD